MFIIRPCKTVFDPFIYNSWIRTLRNEDQYRHVDANWLTTAQHALIEKILASAAVACVSAHPEDDPDTILGYAVGERRGVLHFIYVKKNFRQLGLATRLLDLLFDEENASSMEVTEVTRDLAYLRNREPVKRTIRLCQATKVADRH